MRWTMTFLTLLLFGGCSVVKDVPEPAYVRLHPESFAADNRVGTCHDRVLRLAAPDAPMPLQTIDIVYSDSNGTVYRYTKTRWETPPVLQWRRLVETTLAGSGLFKAVVSDDSLAKSDWIMEWRLADMSQAIADDGSARTRLSFFVSVLDRYSREVIAQRLFTYTRTQKEGGLQRALASWNAMGERFEGDLAEWFAQLCKRYPATRHRDAGL